MQTPYDTRLPSHLRALKLEIEGYAREFGLDFYETIFEVIDADDLNEVAAYGGFPTRYPHWSFGMAYEELRKSYEYGLSKIYEMVINNDPCYAYLMRSNHVVDQKLVMAHVYGHCLAPETKVVTRTGVKPIDAVAAGEEVLTHRGVYRRVRYVNRRAHAGQIHAFTVSGSNEKVRITGEHPVYVLRPASCTLAGRARVNCRPNCQIQHKCKAPRPYEAYRLEWVPAANVRAGDFVVLPRERSRAITPPRVVLIPVDKVIHRRHVQGTKEIPISPALGKFIGYYLAEGSAQERGVVGLGFHQDEETFHQEVANLATTLFGVNVGQDHYPRQHAITVRFNSLEVARWSRKEVGTSSANKRIPQWLLENDQETLQACLTGLFNGDGYYTQAQGRKSGTLSLSTVSEQLAYQVRNVAARLGMRVSVNMRKRDARQPVYEVIWSGVSGHQLSQLLYGKDVLAGNRLFERSWSDDNYTYQQVRDVEVEPYDGQVVNFSVEEDESYTLAAGFVVHNCDFFKNNAYFAHTSRKMMDEMANHGARIRSYAEKYGEDEVEAFVDRCMSIDDLIDVHSVAIRRREETSRYDFTPEAEASEGIKPTRFRSKDYMDEYINPRDVLKAELDEQRKQREQTARSFPEQPQKDVLLFLIEYAPLKNWQRDILSVIRDEAYYFAPQGMTKILNEGWACLTSNSLILTSQGVLRLGDLVERRQQVQVSDGEQRRDVCDWARFTARDTIRIRTRRGLEVEGSITHRLQMPDATWKRLDELSVGDKVRLAVGTDLWASEPVAIDWQPDQRLTLEGVAALAGTSIDTVCRHLRGKRTRVDGTLVPVLSRYQGELATRGAIQNRRKPIRIPASVDEDFAAFLGYLTGDGHISARKRTIGLTTADESQADHFAELTERLFGITPPKHWDESKWRVKFSSRNVQDLLIHLGLKTGVCAREKTVPDVILRSPRPVVAAFLRALYDCDGYAGKAGVILSTSSTEMSKVIQMLLLNFGILSTRVAHKDCSWHVHTLGASTRTFEETIGFGLPRKQEKLRQYIDAHKWFKSQSHDDEVVAIDRGQADVFDITVETTHRYAAQGFINHNSYWHSTIMTQKALSPTEVVDYADHHSGTMAMSRTRLNPYKVGIELLRDIEMRWNTGRFGREYEECDDVEKKRTWDKNLGLGRQKIFEVRRIHNDITFIDTFLTPEFCVQHNLFSFAYQEQAGQYFIESRDFEKIKQRLLFSLTNFGKPWIYVVDGNYRNRGELLLKHQHNGVDLKLDQAADVLAHIQFIWTRPVHLTTLVDGKVTTLCFDGTDHSIRTGGETDDSRRNPPAKTR